MKPACPGHGHAAGGFPDRNQVACQFVAQRRNVRKCVLGFISSCLTIASQKRVISGSLNGFVNCCLRSFSATAAFASSSVMCCHAQSKLDDVGALGTFPPNVLSRRSVINGQNCRLIANVGQHSASKGPGLYLIISRQSPQFACDFFVRSAMRLPRESTRDFAKVRNGQHDRPRSKRPRPKYSSNVLR
jgi:hypothetical protein